ncbi:S-layer homology domain-containing protein [Cohnella terricola]|uniref:S-layer homology domain-containing protein n=1 Tax=Cohnella terricola TaxID=1289167 RepID=A0A559JNB4_9BACL|nr:S-layer homology domain-containing protein [Cohnella terricola]TVY01353.1 S-layer homology domain-containing protein [Cohnella terricola]
MHRLSVITLIIAFLGTGNAAYAQQSNSAPFKDIKGHWAEKTITEMVSKGILDGYPNGTFRPDEPVKVDQFIKMLVLSYSNLHQNGERSWNPSFFQSLSTENQTILKQDYRYYNFKPATAGYWAKPYIDVASDLHFLNKSRYSDFQSDMTRENVAEVLFYTLQETEFLEDSQFSLGLAQSYGDLMSATERERKFIAEALAKGIMQGYPNGYFGVGDKVTRAQSLVLLNRLTEKTKRIEVKASARDDLQLAVPTVGGGSKIVVFPDRRMRDAYDALKQSGALRGSNQDLLDTRLRLFKDQKEKESVLSSSSSGTAKVQEEVSIWLDPQYNTYGITIRLRDGTLARNQEAVETFSDYLFGYNSATFRKWFNEVCVSVESGTKVSSKQVEIGGDTVDIRIDSSAKTVVFSIAKRA